MLASRRSCARTCRKSLRGSPRKHSKPKFVKPSLSFCCTRVESNRSDLQKMKILVLSPQIPWPLYGGNVVRVYGILKELSRHGHEIVLLAGSEGPPLPADHPLRVLCREVIQYPRPASAKQSHPI